MSATAVLVQAVRSKVVTIVAADTTTLKTVCTAAGTFWFLQSIVITSDDTSNRIVQFWATISGTDYLIGSVVVPTLAGTDGVVAAKQVLSDPLFSAAVLDALGNMVLPLETAIILKAKTTTTVTAAKTVTIYATATES